MNSGGVASLATHTRKGDNIIRRICAALALDDKQSMSAQTDLRRGNAAASDQQFLVEFAQISKSKQ